MTVRDTVFANITSNYATAVFTDHTYTYIYNSKFTNLRANTTAGAIGLKVSPVTIEDCEFINVSSAKNGGAIFADDDIYDATSTVIRTLFENCSSGFGGAFLQLAGKVLIINSTFNNNHATYDGGAIYISTSEDVNIANSNFTLNTANNTGGADYIDNSVANISNSKFENNDATSFGDALLLYESNYIMNDLEFNGHHSPIYTYFEETAERNNLTGSDEIPETCFNNTNYPYFVLGGGAELELVDSPFNFTELPSRLNLKDYGLVTPVKDQGMQGSCWAFGTIAALESALLLKTNVSYDFSENNLQDLMLIYSKYGSTEVSEGGYSTLGFAYLLNWFGMLPQEYDSYDELGKISPILLTPYDIHIQDIILLPYQAGNVTSINEIKKAIVEYGALMGEICFGATAFDQGPSTYNEKFYSLYTPEFVSPNHMITVVGWDDNFPKENFTVTPPANGAWIVKNSWGKEWGDEGYFYISYYDQTLCNYDIVGLGAAFVGIIFENTINYTKNYQYDFPGIYDYLEADGSNFTLINTYEAIEDDVIAAVGTYFYPNSPYSMEILINDSSVYKQEGIAPYFGYHTVKLDNYVSIKEGDKFSIVMVLDNYAGVTSQHRVKYAPGVSVSIVDYIISNDTSEGIVNCIKAYTLDEPFSAEKIVETYSECKPFIVNVTESGLEVSIRFDNETMTNTSDENGIATFNLPLMEHGTHPIYVTCKNKTVVSSVTVKSTIDVPDEITVAHDANANITVTYYMVNGTELTSMTLPLPNEMGTYTLNFKNSYTGEERNSTVNVISRFLIHKDATTCYGAMYNVMVAGDDGAHALEGENVTFEIIGKKAIVPTNQYGMAAVYLPLEVLPGIHTITVTYKGESVKHTITVEHVINSNKTVSVYLTDNKLTLEAQLIYDQKPFPEETVTFKLNGKTYTTVTGNDGIARVTLKQNDIKQLKAGKYTIGITFEKEVLNTTLIVKQPLTADKAVSIKNIDKQMVLKASLKYDNVPQANKKITFKFNGKTYTATTDKNGIAKVTINANVIKKLKAGAKYTVTISYLNDLIKTTVNVKKILSSKKTVTLKKTAKKLVLKATLKDGKTPLKNKRITFRFNGKTYKAKTNAKGIAQVTIKKNVIKKLKAKKYTVKIAYQNNIVKTTVNVKKILSSKKTVTVKKSAKKLVLKATLKDGKKALKKKRVTFKFRGKTYRPKTNTKGIAKVTIKKNVIKKLKAGKKYTVAISYLNDNSKTIVKVKR